MSLIKRAQSSEDHYRELLKAVTKHRKEIFQYYDADESGNVSHKNGAYLSFEDVDDFNKQLKELRELFYRVV